MRWCSSISRITRFGYGMWDNRWDESDLSPQNPHSIKQLIPPSTPLVENHKNTLMMANGLSFKYLLIKSIDVHYRRRNLRFSVMNVTFSLISQKFYPLFGAYISRISSLMIFKNWWAMFEGQYLKSKSKYLFSLWFDPHQLTVSFCR